jgi:hypothetical protein
MLSKTFSTVILRSQAPIDRTSFDVCVACQHLGFFHTIPPSP